jgi:hypothetical protein
MSKWSNIKLHNLKISKFYTKKNPETTIIFLSAPDQIPTYTEINRNQLRSCSATNTGSINNHFLLRAAIILLVSHQCPIFLINKSNDENVTIF